MQITTKIFIVVLLLVLVACQSRSETLLDPNTKQAITKSQPVLYKDESKFEKIIKAVENNNKLLEIQSLSYDNEKQSHSLKGLMNGPSDLVKLTHLQEIYNPKQIITTDFYFDKKYLVCAAQRRDNGLNLENSVVEIKSYYNSNNEVVFSSKRSATSPAVLDKAYFEITKKTNISSTIAFDILQQKGDFETRFLGFVDNKYLVVGSNGVENYTSALMIKEQKNEVVDLLMSDEKYFLNALVNVKFTEVTMPNGFRAQGLETITIVKE